MSTGNDPTQPPFSNNPQATPVAMPQRSVITQASVPLDRPVRVEIVQSGFFGKYSTRIAWIIAALCFFSAMGTYAAYEAYQSPNPKITEQHFVFDAKLDDVQLAASDKIAIISVTGTIMHQDGFAKWQIDQVRKDKNVRAVVLRVDSPGGTVTGSNYIWHHLKQLQKERQMPIVVSMGGICASGGYYVSMAASTGKAPAAKNANVVEEGDAKPVPQESVIFAEETTWTGSIGVIIPHYDVSELLSSWNIKDDSVVSHRLKNAGSPTKTMTEEERKIFQELVDESFKEFKVKVLEGRPNMTPDELDKVATGQIFTATQAKKAGLVDEIGYLEDAVKQAAKLAGISDLATVRAVKYKKQTGLLDGFTGGEESATSQMQAIQKVLDFSTPRAYFLFTSLPAMLKSSE